MPDHAPEFASAFRPPRRALIARRTPPGPEWLALPVPAEAVVDQLARESGWHALSVLPLALGLVAVGAGLTPWRSLAILAAAFLAILPFADRAGTVVAWWPAVWRHPRAAAGLPAPHPLMRLPSPARLLRGTRLPAARRGVGTTRALLLQELARSLHSTPARTRAATWVERDHRASGGGARDRAVILHLGRVVRTLTRADWGEPESGPSPLERAFLSATQGRHAPEDPA